MSESTPRPPATPSAPGPSAPRPTPPPGRTAAPRSEPWGRVDDSGAVFVRTDDGEVLVGQWLAGSPDEGLRFYERKYATLSVEIDLLAHRLTDAGLAPDEAMAAIGKLRDQVDPPSCVGDLKALTARLDELVTVVDERRAARRAEREHARTEARARREALVVEAEKLADSTQWKATGDRYRALVEEWRTAPHTDRATEQELWKRLSHARSAFEKRRRAWFAQRDTQRAEATAVKEKIVKEAEALASSKDWGPTSNTFRSLMQRWKAAGPATRDAENELWQRFKAAQDTFFSARASVYSERDAEQQQNLQAKRQLADEAERLLPVQDLDSARATLRSIQDRWAQIGHVPRADRPAVERRLQQVEQAVRQAEEARWKRTNPEARARAAATAEQLTSSIAKLERQLAAAEASGDARKADEAREALTARRQWLAQAEAALQEFGG